MKKDVVNAARQPDDSNTEAMQNDSDITPLERKLLDESGEDEEERDLHKAELDDSDADGEPLNEAGSATDRSGRDLDVPGSNDDDEMEDIGEEDEENNSYSEADTE